MTEAVVIRLPQPLFFILSSLCTKTKIYNSIIYAYSL